MRGALVGLLAGAALGGAGVGLLASAARSPAAAPGPHAPEASAEAGAAPPGQPATPDGAGWVRLDRDARALAGIAVAPVRGLELPVERVAYGRVLDPAPLADAAYELEAAAAAHAAAQREAARVRSLYRADENASARELESAEVARARAKSALETVRARIETTWGASLARRDDLAALVDDLVAGRRALVRVDAPPDGSPGDAAGSTGSADATADEPGAARLVAFGSGAPLASRFLGPAPWTDPLLQGRGLLFVVEGGPPPPGTAVEAWLRSPGPAARGVEIPRAALLRHAGGVFVYVARGPDRFERRAVELVRPSDAGWLARGPLVPGDPLVVAGASVLLSAELQPRLAED